MVFLRVREVLTLGDEVEIVFTNPKNTEIKQRCLAKLNYHDETGAVELARNPVTPAYPEWLDDTTLVHLYTMKTNGIWSCTIAGITAKGRSLRGAVPAEIEQVQRRRHVRINYTGFATLEVEPTPEQRALGRRTKDRYTLPIQNISAGGIRLSSPVHLVNEQVVNVQFEVKTHPKQGKPEPRLYELEAKVVYCYIPKDTPSTKPILLPRETGGSYICALQFNEVPPSIERQLMQQCFQLEIEQRKVGWGTNL